MLPATPGRTVALAPTPSSRQRTVPIPNIVKTTQAADGRPNTPPPERAIPLDRQASGSPCAFERAAYQARLTGLHKLDGGTHQLQGLSVSRDHVARFMRTTYPKQQQIFDQMRAFDRPGKTMTLPPYGGCKFRSMKICEKFQSEFPGALVAQLWVFPLTNDGGLAYASMRESHRDAPLFAWKYHVVPIFLGDDELFYVIDPFLRERSPVELGSFFSELSADGRKTLKISIAPPPGTVQTLSSAGADQGPRCSKEPVQPRGVT